MKLFRCQACEQVLHFENTRCERSGHVLGFLPEEARLTALEPLEGGAWRTLAQPEKRVRFCANAQHDACNWLVKDGPGNPTLCLSCRHNQTVPDLTVAANLPPWRNWQIAERRLAYTLLRLGLPMPDRFENPTNGLAWDVLADPPAGGPRVMTGHQDGVVTLALAEADDVERERRRSSMGEPYRTLLGHVRHESGHFYWDMLVRDARPDRLEECRAVFGDDRADYDAALQRHHATGAPVDWRNGFVSAYATAHPWEDFAETWAHWLHIIDTLEMASAFHLSVDTKADQSESLSATIDLDPYATSDFGTLIEAWLPLTHAVNSLNRCMGAPDLYPFVLSAPVVEKLGWIHRLVRESTHAEPGQASPEAVEVVSGDG